MTEERPLVEIDQLSKIFEKRTTFGGKLQRTRAVTNVSLAIRRGENFALVGESGSGKTTAGRLVLRLLDPTAGTIRFDGADITNLSRSALRPFRRRMQMIFQDPYSSLNPYMEVGAAIEEALIIHGIGANAGERQARVSELLDMVGLRAHHANRFPHEFSGGQRQRIGIARALAVDPEFIVADEPVSALDVSVQAQVINLLEGLRQKLGLAMLFIAHDLAVVRHVATHVGVMYLGHVVELAPADTLFAAPRHPYTEALLSAAPRLDASQRSHRIILKGDIPSPLNPPSGCPFRTRCMHARPQCAETEVSLQTVGEGHATACLRHEEIYGKAPSRSREDSPHMGRPA
ncbi:ABC transporter ATP-binding protein [Shinella sp.]|uniref:ABC transporter ATP-binding protein n=1 Tax=Shinella sp. TaxID=1870904 RepID=UPI003F6F1CAE